MISKVRHILGGTALITILLAVVMLFCGCSESTNWVRRKIEENYYCFNEQDYASLGNLKGLSIAQMMARLDRYSAYYSPKEYEAVLADNQGSKSGIGVTYSYTSGKGIVLQSVVGNSPAKRVGLKAGDIIISGSAKGRNVAFDSSNSFSTFMSSLKTDENMTLTLFGGDSVTLAKEEYTASYASMYTAEASYDIEYSGSTLSIEKGVGGGISELPEDTAYIYLSQFYGNAVNEMGVLINEFNTLGCNTLILDLRGNGGGYVDVMARIGYRFTAKVKSNAVAMKAIYKSGREEIDYCYLKLGDKPYVLPAGTKVYAMANSGTASASEALLGVLVSYNILEYENIFLSEYAGSVAKSYGKGIMQSTFVNNLTGEALKLTVAGIYWANGVTIHDRGLTAAEFGCSVAPATDSIVNIGYDDELLHVIAKINSDRQN